MMRPLSFLHVSTFYPPYSFGGDAVYVARLCKALAGRGHHVEVVHCMDSYELFHRGETPAPQREDGVTVHALRSGWRWLSPLLTQQTGFPLLKRRALERIVSGRRFDVVHFHNISLFGPAVLRMETGNERVLKVYTTHEYWLVCPTSTLYQYNVRPCVKRACLACQLRAARPPQSWRSTKLLEDCSRHVDLLLASSQASARHHRERGFPHAFAELPLFAERLGEATSGAAPHARPYFLYVGRLERLKGPQTLVRLWGSFADADLALAGTGTEEQRLRKMAAGNARVRFLGNLGPGELAAWYRNALALIVPTATYEMFGLVIAEAFSHGTPVIAHNIGGMPEAMEQSHAGIVYRSEEELRAVLRQVASSPALRRELNEKALAAWMLRWTPEAHLDRYFDLLEGTALRKFGTIPWRICTNPSPSES